MESILAGIGIGVYVLVSLYVNNKFIFNHGYITAQSSDFITSDVEIPLFTILAILWPITMSYLAVLKLINFYKKPKTED